MIAETNLTGFGIANSSQQCRTIKKKKYLSVVI